MAETEFNSSWFWENETYEELHEMEYSSRRKGVNQSFITFLTANFKELEFTKKKKFWEYTFEQDKNEKMRVSVDGDGVHVIAVHKNKENEDIDEEFVDRDNGETFEKLMDRIMDALEVMECKIFDLECNTKTNVGRTPKQIKSGREKFKKMKKEKKKVKKRKNDEIDPYDPSDVDCKDEVIETKKRRSSQRLKKHKKQKSESVDDDGLEESETVSVEKVNRRKRKREVSVSVSLDCYDNDDEETEEIVIGKPKRKKRRVNDSKKKKKNEMRDMKREFTKLWICKEYHDAFVLAKDEYSMKKKQINQWIEDIYDNDL